MRDAREHVEALGSSGDGLGHQLAGETGERHAVAGESLRIEDVRCQPPKIGRDGKWQLNLYDPNLTRVELMEPKPVETPCCSPMKTR